MGTTASFTPIGYKIDKFEKLETGKEEEVMVTLFLFVSIVPEIPDASMLFTFKLFTPTENCG
jgi:hypothetical protein